MLLAFCLSDYIMLFPVRKFLSINTNIILILTVSFLIVCLCFAAILSVVDITVAWLEYDLSLSEAFWSVVKLWVAILSLNMIFSVYIGMLPAILVFLWLPLLALSMLILRLLNWLFRATAWFQWFLKQGKQHPLQAIGTVAAILVFSGASVIKVFF